MADAKIVVIGQDKTSAVFGKIKGSMGRLNKSVQGMQSSFGGLGRIMSAGIAFQGFKSIIDVSLIFEDRLAEINTIAKLSSEQLDSLGKSLEEMSTRVPKSAEELGAGFYQILSAGVTDTTEALKVLEISTKLATAGLSDTASTVKLVTSVIKSFGLEVSDAEKVSDILFKTVERGVTTIPELAGSLGRVLPIAKAAGIQFEEVASAIATLTSRGLATDEAVVALRGTFTALSSPTEGAKKIMDKMGISMKDSTGKIKDFVDIVTQFKGLPIEVMAKLIPDVRARTAVLILAENYETLGENVVASFDAGGASVGAFNTQMKTNSAQMKLALNEFASFRKEVGGILAPVLADVLKTFSDLPKPIKILTVIVPILTAAFIALGGPITAIAAGISLLVIGVSKLWQRFKNAKEQSQAFQDALDAAAKKAQDFGKAVGAPIFDIGVEIKDLTKITKAQFNEIVKSVDTSTEEGKRALETFTKAWKEANEKRTVIAAEEDEKVAAKRLETLAKTQDLMFEMETIGLEKYIEILNLRVEVFKGTEEERVLFALETEQRITELRQNAANEQMLITQELGRAVQGVFSAIENSIVGAIVRATDTTKSGLEKWKLFFQDMGRAVLAILARLIARLIIFRALTAALGPGGAIFGFGAQTLAGFQTPEGVTRRVPGPSTQAVPVIAHGGETIGRQGGQPITINFNGIVTDPDATGEVIFDTLNQYMQRNDTVFA